MNKYKINPDFVAPEPTPADFFAFLTEEEYQAGDREPIFDRWRDEGVQQVRLTIVNAEYPNDPYPHGVWFEGWRDPKAQQLPFGGEYQGGVWPPLTFQPEESL